MKHALLALAIAALLASSVPLRAQEASADPLPESSPLLSALGTTITAGYQSRYVLYGYRLSRHLFHGDVYFYLPLQERLSVWAGSWYGYLTDGTYHEVDVYGGADYQVASWLSLGAAYSMFNYIEVPFPTSNQAHEFTLKAVGTFGPLSLTIQNQYDTEAEGSLARAIAAYRVGLTEKLALALQAEYGHAFDYFIEGDAANHAIGTLRLPYALSEQLSLSPFIARTEPLDAIEDFEEAETYYGITASWSF